MPSIGNLDTAKRLRKREFVWLLELKYWSLRTSDLDIPSSFLLLDDNIFHSTLACHDFIVRLSCFLCSLFLACYSWEPLDFKIVWVYFYSCPLSQCTFTHFVEFIFFFGRTVTNSVYHWKYIQTHASVKFQSKMPTYLQYSVSLLSTWNKNIVNTWMSRFRILYITYCISKNITQIGAK